MQMKQITISDLIAKYAGTLWKSGTAHAASAYGYLLELAELMPDTFSTITAADYDAIVTVLRKRGNKNSTINRKINAFTKLLRAANADSAIPNVPTFKRLAEKNNELRFLSTREEEQIVNAIGRHSDANAALTTFLIETGVNVGEAITSRWENISGDFIHIPESTSGLARRLPLTLKARSALDKMGHELRGPFSRIEQPKYRAAWNECKDELGLSEDAAIVPTVLRHTCACRLIMQGVELRVVQRWLGNRNYKSMIRYENLVPLDNFSLCVSALENFKE